jgi:hypothetical protein
MPAGFPAFLNIFGAFKMPLNELVSVICNAIQEKKRDKGGLILQPAMRQVQ